MSDKEYQKAHIKVLREIAKQLKRIADNMENKTRDKNE